MRALSSALRKQLETAIVGARRAAESASRAAVDNLGVFAERRPEHLDEDQASLRVGLRAKWRQLGNDRDLLISECAYEQWHRLLFARFLAENKLLLHPEYKAPVSLADCEELAGELGEPDGWSVAARFASEILPGIFRLEDPCMRLRLAPEGRHALEIILNSIPTDTFGADDALGWVYQFWQKEKKDEVNASERKIGGADLGPVTQLFTENYMVRFLLENSLGAWWTTRHPESPLVKNFDYLRFDEEGKPAAGSFEGWPQRVAEVTVMDPCCGSGHFLVEAFSLLWQMRAEEEALDPTDAQDAVLRDNLFGLELDPRCVQIAMFLVALYAWKTGGGWRQLPMPQIACAGTTVRASSDEWMGLAQGDQRVEKALNQLHVLFGDGETLGTLINPMRIGSTTAPYGQTSFEDAEWNDYASLLEVATSSESTDPALAVLGSDASSSSRAAALLSKQYTLITTNVPFLARGRQSELLARHIETQYPKAKADLATAMISRLWEMSKEGGTLSVVSPIQWVFLSSYTAFRQVQLRDRSIRMLVRLGSRAFSGIGGEVASASLMIASALSPSQHDDAFLHIDVTKKPSPEAKASALTVARWDQLHQTQQLGNPSSIISPEYERASSFLEDFANGYAGIQTGDLPRFVRYFWEVDASAPQWAYYQGTVDTTTDWGGLEKVLLWEEGEGNLHRFISDRLGGSVGAWIRGIHCRGKRGVSVSQMGALPVALYSGELFDLNNAVVLPKNPDDLGAIWQFCRSPQFTESVRAIDQSLKVTNQTLVKVPFDIDHWRKVAEAAGPLPEPFSDDPTQWLFTGRPEVSTSALQVAVARLVGYSWPEQAESDDLDSFQDADGIVCLPSVAGEAPAADRVQQVLATAFAESWSPTKAKDLLLQSGSKKTIAEWLRDDFFKQHCALFSSRPFVWHIWDGLRDGFSALVNYHQLDRKKLEKLTYTYLGQDWVERQRAELRDEVPGAEARLAAALNLQRRLEAILEGEPPYDIYVRWKPLHEQPIGWEPDLSDGVRLNIRPCVEAGVLRSTFNIYWRKDRGRNSDGSERDNDIHLSVAEKREARRQAAHD